MEKDNGGPAFPQFMGMATNPEGMTLRDWFAGQALAGLTNVAYTYFTGASEKEKAGARQFASDIGETAYLIADAMIAERNKES